MPQPILPLPPLVEWGEWFPRWRWEQGEHLAVIQETGGGKTTLVRALLPKRTWVVYIATKPKDDNYQKLLDAGYVRVKDWKERPRRKDGKPLTHILFWPPLEGKGHLAALQYLQRYKDAIQQISEKGGRCVVLDDLNFMVEIMHMGTDISGLNYMVRASGLSMVEPIQRPAWVPRSTWNQASWDFIGSVRDDQDLKTIRGILKVNMLTAREWMETIPEYHWIVAGRRMRPEQFVMVTAPYP